MTTYNSLLKELLEKAEEQGLRPIYAYGNESETETPEGFYFGEVTQREIELEENNKQPWSEHYYENRLEVEVEEGINAFSIRDSQLFQIMVYGNLDKLKEVLDNPELLSEYIENMFGSYSEFLIETEEEIENGPENRETEKEFAIAA